MKTTITAILILILSTVATGQAVAAGFPKDRFLSNGSSKFYDTYTRLEWETSRLGYTFDWESAANQCLNLSGGNWRLPTPFELISITDSRCNRTNGCGPAMGDLASNRTPRVWSSDGLPHPNVLLLDFATGELTPTPHTQFHRVMCVRAY